MTAGGGSASFHVAPRHLVRVSGTDRVAYLHRMLSQDVRALAPGYVAEACLLTPQGRMVAWPLLWVTSTTVLLDLDPETTDDAVARLERTVIADDVRFEACGEALRASVWGPGAPEVARALGAEGIEVGRIVQVDGRGGTSRLARLGAFPAFVVLADPAGGDVLLERLVALGATGPVADVVWDDRRVAARHPIWGAEVTPDILPLEARLEDTAISFTKGCYPGQEPVSMARHRGRPPHRLVRLVLEDAPGASAGTVVLRDGRSAGRLTTVASDAARALALVRHALALPGEAFDVEGGGHARVIEPEGEA